MTDLADLERRIWALDAKIEPLMDRTVPRPRVPMLDRAGIRDEAEALLRAILDAYVAASPGDQASIRTLFCSFCNFAWAIGGAVLVSLPEAEAVTVGRCRDVLTFFVIEDQGRDPRDAILWLQKLCRAAEFSGLPLKTLLIEAAHCASDEARFAKIGGQSTRQLLLDYAKRYEA